MKHLAVSLSLVALACGGPTLKKDLPPGESPGIDAASTTDARPGATADAGPASPSLPPPSPGTSDAATAFDRPPGAIDAASGRDGGAADAAAQRDVQPSRPVDAPAEAVASVAEFFASLADATCERVFSCCSEASRNRLYDDAAMPVTDRRSCTVETTRLYAAERTRRLGQIARGTARFAPEAAAGCLAAVRAGACGILEVRALPPACDGVFVGLLAPNAACTSSEECSTGLCPNVVGPSPTGRCLAKPACWMNVPAGQTPCAAGQYCDGLSGLCTALPTEGQACRSGIPCAAGAICLAARAATGVITGYTCQRPGAEGTTCADGRACATGLVCVQVRAASGAVSGTCRAPAPDGGFCVTDDHCVSGICAPTAPSMGSCQPRAQPGGTCNRGNGCVDGHYCALGPKLCVPQLAPGQACSADYECQAGTSCATTAPRTCISRRIAGQPCTRALDCVAGLFCDPVAGSTCRAKLDDGAACSAADACKNTCHFAGFSGLCGPASAPPLPAVAPAPSRAPLRGWPYRCETIGSDDDDD